MRKETITLHQSFFFLLLLFFFLLNKIKNKKKFNINRGTPRSSQWIVVIVWTTETGQQFGWDPYSQRYQWRPETSFEYCKPTYHRSQNSISWCKLSNIYKFPVFYFLFFFWPTPKPFYPFTLFILPTPFTVKYNIMLRASGLGPRASGLGGMGGAGLFF